MENSSDKKRLVEDILQTKYEQKGFLSEDDIIDVCIEYDLDLVEIDNLCDKLLGKKMIVNDGVKQRDNDSFVDRSHLDYDKLLEKIRTEYPNCSALIDNILGILPPQSKEWQNLIGEAQNGNKYACDRMIKMYLRTVMKQAYYFSRDNYCDFEEAFQNGVIGLINAIRKYDLSSPDLFSAYFPLWVRQSMQRECYFKGTLMRYPTHYKDQLTIVVSMACNVMENDDIEEAIDIIGQSAFEQAGITEGEVTGYILPYMELTDDMELADDSEDNIGKLLQESLRIVIKDMLATLKGRERFVLEMRYGLVDDQERTLEEVGKIMNVTRERVRQIEAKALKKLKVRCLHINLDDYLY